MKKIISAAVALGLCLGLAGCGAQEGGGFGFLTAVLLLLGLAALAFAAMRTMSFIQYNRRRRRNPRWKKKAVLDVVTIGTYAVGAALLLLALLTMLGGGEPADPTGGTDGSSGTASSTGTTTGPAETTTEPTEPPVLFQATGSDSSDPDLWGVNWEILVGGQEVESYTREEPIRFGDPSEYFVLPGISAFRGNNYRDSATYGTADVVSKTLTIDWSYGTSTLSGTSWSGSGWTGQPLIVQWDAQTRSNMNLYEDKKAKDGLVEVIYATLDGHIYFLDLDDGTPTRDAINVGMCFKGAGSLDPRGYPLMYVGSGDVSSGKQPRMFIISLIDGTILYEYGHDDPLSVRRDNDDWCAFDSSPLVDAETDTLIWPGENGILYTIKLNSSYDAAAGTVSIAPETTVVTRYQTNRSSEEEYWFGYEASVNIVENYLYVSENGGMFYCVDLNTMELVWAQDTKDDSNASPVFEQTENGGYVYTAPSLHWTKNEDYTGTISLYKLDAVTGEIVWETPYDVHTVDGVSGGVQSSPLLGKAGSTMDGLIIYSVSRIPYEGSGILVALDTATGQEVWRKNMDNYAWSSPVAVYDANGTGYVVICDFGGNAYFLDGATGETLYTLDMGGMVEASPAVYGDMLVVGTRNEQILGVKIG